MTEKSQNFYVFLILTWYKSEEQMDEIFKQGLVHNLGCQEEVGRTEMISLLIDNNCQVYSLF